MFRDADEHKTAKVIGKEFGLGIPQILPIVSWELEEKNLPFGFPIGTFRYIEARGRHTDVHLIKQKEVEFICAFDNHPYVRRGSKGVMWLAGGPSGIWTSARDGGAEFWVLFPPSSPEIKKGEEVIAWNENPADGRIHCWLAPSEGKFRGFVSEVDKGLILLRDEKGGKMGWFNHWANP